MQLPRRDAAELKRIDDEFIAKYDSIPSLDLQPLDPATDPFGRNYAWLKPPSHPYDLAFDTYASQPASLWYQSGGSELRNAVLGGSLAAGTDEEIFQKWAKENFSTFCYASGEDGEDMLAMLKSEGALAQGVVYEIATMLESHPAFAGLSAEKRVIAAMIAIDTLRPQSPA